MLFYRVEYYKDGQIETLTLINGIRTTSLDITNLSKGTRYTVRVYAANSVGESTASNSVTTTTNINGKI